MDVYVHACCNCPITFSIQQLWWDMITENHNLDLFVELNSYNEEQLYQVLLGGIPERFQDDIDTESFTKLNYTHVVNCIAEYSRAIGRANT